MLGPWGNGEVGRACGFGVWALVSPWGDTGDAGVGEAEHLGQHPAPPRGFPAAFSEPGLLPCTRQ